MNNDTIDFISCEIKKNIVTENILNYIENNLEIKINRTEQKIGNKKLGGTWFLNDTNLKDIYFNDKIYDYPYILGPSSQHCAFIITSPPSNNYITNNNITSINNFANRNGDNSIGGGNSNSYVIACGNNSNGQLGIGNTNDISIPKYMICKFILIDEQSGNQITKYGILNNIVQVSCGANHTVVLDSDGNIYACGDNSYGQLGTGNNNTSENYLVSIPNPSVYPIRGICCGANHTILIDSADNVYGCGDNSNNQIIFFVPNESDPFSIIEPLTTYTNFTQIMIDKDYPLQGIAVACGDNHTLILQNDNYVLAFGNNDYNQLSTDTGPTDNAGNIVNSYGGVAITNIKQIACGSNHSVLLDNDGNIWGCGKNDKKQLTANYNNDENNFGDFITKITNDTQYDSVACGGEHTVCIKSSDKKLHGCGNCGSKQLYNSDTNPDIITDFTELISDKTITSVCCGSNNTYAQTNDNKIYSCGDNTHGQVGNNTHGQVGNNTTGNPVNNTNILDPNPDQGTYSVLTTAMTLEVSCFNEDTKILCIIDNQEKYIPIQNIRNGILVKTLDHGNRKVIGIGKGFMKNNPDDWRDCMYILSKLDNPDMNIIEDLIITGGHSILVDEISEDEIENHRGAFGELQLIDNKYLELAGLSKKFKKIHNRKIYTYYHLILENDGNNDTRYGIWANVYYLKHHQKIILIHILKFYYKIYFISFLFID